MTQITGMLRAGARIGASKAIVQGEAILTAPQIKQHLGVSAGSLMRTNDAKAAELAVDGVQAWPLETVRTRAVARNLTGAAQLDRLGDANNRFVPLEAARQTLGMSEDAFLEVVDAQTLPRVLVRPTSGGPFEQLVPEQALTQLAKTYPGASDAARGAVEAGGKKPMSMARVMLVGGALGLGPVIGVAALSNRDGSTEQAATAPAAPAPQDEPAKPEAPKEPTAAELKAAARAEMGEKIANLAKGELGTTEEFDGDGNTTSDVKQYFSVSADAKPTDDWNWQGYFAAWVRQEAGAPISPGTDWLTIADLVEHGKKEGTWREPKAYSPQVGDVVFMQTGSGDGKDRVANDTGIIVGVNGDELQLVQGSVGETNQPSTVAATTISKDHESIRGYVAIKV